MPREEDGVLDDVNLRAPAIASASAFVNAPAEAVWDVLTDFTSWPAWNKSVSKMEMQGDVREGGTFVWTADGVKIRSTLERVERPKRIVWSGRTLGIRAIHVWDFTEKNGGTIVRTAESFEGPVAWLFRGMMRRMLSKAVEQGLAALKSEAEARQGKAGT